ncbi:MAG: multicopper oxidase family protein [Candidatus Velthaea sp.]
MSVGSAAGAQTADVFPAIPEVRAVNGSATVAFHVILDPVTGAPTFSYGAVAGVVPTIRVQPGDTIAMTVANDLPHVRRGPANDINVHFHGLTVSPQAPGDAPTSVAHAGETIVYRVRVPRNHEPGLYWYHPHAHGETYRDVTGGMSGAIVVEGLQRHFPALAAMRERILVLRDVATGPGGLVDADMPMMAMPGTAAAGTAGRRTPRRNGDPCRAEPGLQPTLNRQARGRIRIAPGESQFFRVVNAAAARYFDLSVDGSRLEVLALDGIARDAYPGTAPARYVDHLVVPPAGRAEFVVRAPAHATVLRSACFDSGAAGDANPAVILADLADDSATGIQADGVPSGPEEARITAAAAVTPGAALPDNSYSRPLPRPAAFRRIRFTEDARGFYIGGKTFDMRAPPSAIARSGTVERWTIENATDEVHAFHIHQVHFVVTEAGSDEDERVWRDTVNVPPQHRSGRAVVPGSVTLLVDFRNPVVRGTFFYHCHILDHADGGMMAKIEVR